MYLQVPICKVAAKVLEAQSNLKHPARTLSGLKEYLHPSNILASLASVIKQSRSPLANNTCSNMRLRE